MFWPVTKPLVSIHAFQNISDENYNRNTGIGVLVLAPTGSQGIQRTRFLPNPTPDAS